MAEVNWKCPNCNNENTKQVNINDCNRGYIENGVCDDCLMISELTIELVPVAVSVGLKSY